MTDKYCKRAATTLRPYHWQASTHGLALLEPTALPTQRMDHPHHDHDTSLTPTWGDIRDDPKRLPGTYVAPSQMSQGDQTGTI